MPEKNDIELQAFAVVGQTLVWQLIAKLMEMGLLSRADTMDIVRNAHNVVLKDRPSTPEYQLAREMLEFMTTVLSTPSSDKTDSSSE